MGLPSAIKLPKNLKSRQPSEKVIFYRPSQKCRVKLTIKKFPSIPNLTILAFLKNFLTGNTGSQLLKNTLSKQYNTLQPAYIWKYF